MATKAAADVRPLGVLKGGKAPEHRRLAALMFTDMVGFSALAQRDEALSLELLEEHRHLLRPIFAQHRGVEIKTIGDAFLVELDSALDACSCALEIQRALKVRNETVPPERSIQLRIGIHLGDVVEREGDVYGDGVNIASRIEPLASPGSVCITEDVYRQIRNKLDAPLTKLGRRELKNIELPVEVYRMDLPGTPAAASRARRRNGLAPRWRWAAVALVTLLAGGTAAWMHRPAHEDAGGKVTLAVADFVNETHDPDLDGLSGMLITALEQSSRISVITRQRMIDAAKQLDRPNVERIDEALARQISLSSRADALVIATLRKFEQVYSLELQVLDPRSNERLLSAKAQGEGKAKIPALIDEVSEKTRAGLKEKAQEIRAANRSVEQVATGNLEAYRHYFQGQQLMSKMKFDSANKEYRQAIELDPTFVMAHYALALSLAWFHDPSAKDALRQALPYVGKASEKERLLVQSLAAMLESKPDEALAGYRKLLLSFPDEKDALYMAGDILFHQGKLAEAMPYFEHALEVDPSFVPVLEHSVTAARGLGQVRKMLDYARRYASAASTSRGYLEWSQALANTGDDAQALEIVRLGLQLYPDDPSLLVQPAYLALFHGDLAGAERELRAMAAREDPALRLPATRHLASVLVTQGRLEEALRLLERVDDPPLERRGAFWAGEWYAIRELWLLNGAGDAARAQELERKRLEIQPGTHLLKIFATLWRGEIDEGARQLEAAPPGQYALHELLSTFIACARGQLSPDATLKLDRRSADFGTLGVLGSYLGARCRQLTGQHAQAIEAFQRAQTIVPNRETGPLLALLYPQSFYLMGQSYEALGKPELARGSYEKLLGLWAHGDPTLPALKDARRRLHLTVQAAK